MNLTHHFLLAMPNMQDPRFQQSLTYICEHNKNGAMGLIINQPLDVDIQELFAHMQIQQAKEVEVEHAVYYGGPVESERGFVLHQPTGAWGASIQIQDEICVTTSRDILKAIAAGKGPEKTLTALGYAGWGGSQLETEIGQNSWLSCPATSQILFDTPAEQRLQAAAQLIGIDLSLISSQTGRA
ncbi:MAG: YqgE/AlgH family protein [Gammaproteobacteria bacterium]|nr:YqgE/AlgH family protein [Gammaproteobacteria bacterium]